MAQHDFAPAWLNFPTTPSSAKPSQCIEPPVRLDDHAHVSRRRHNSSDCSRTLNGHAGDPPRPCGGPSRELRNGRAGGGPSDGTSSCSALQHGAPPPRPRGAAPRGGKAKGRHDGEGDRRKQFEAEDFPSLNPEAERETDHCKAVGVWEHPPNPKSRTSRMMVIKRIPREELASAPLSAHLQPPPLGNGPAPYRDPASKSFTLPVKGSRSSSSSPVEQPRVLMRLSRVRADRKSHFLKALKQEWACEDDLCKDERAFHLQNSAGDQNQNPCECIVSQENGNGPAPARQKLFRSSTFPQQEALSSSLEAEHRLLKEMGWQEESENDETCAPLTEDEMKEFQAISEQLQKNGLRRSAPPVLAVWRSSPLTTATEEPETSSSDTSDDDDDL